MATDTTRTKGSAAVALIVRIALTAMTAGLLAACGEGGGSVDDGALALRWTAGPVASCDEAGLVRVDVEFRKGQRILDRRGFACDDGGAFVDAVAPGRYEVVVQGIDRDGISTFEAVLDGVQVDGGGHVDLGTVRLTARPARVALQWYFANGRLCSQNLVEKVAVNVYDSEYYLLGTSEFACDDGAGELEPLSAGAYELEVVGLATGGQEVRARNVVPVVVGRGEDVLVDVALE